MDPSQKAFTDSVCLAGFKAGISSRSPTASLRAGSIPPESKAAFDMVRIHLSTGGFTLCWPAFDGD
jgi:hypothetical protein